MHFNFWGQSLNKGTWLTVAAKDSNYFHQTSVITIKFCLAINQLLPTRAQQVFQSGFYISKSPRSHEYYLFPSSPGKGKRKNTLWECFYFRLFSALLQCHWNIKTETKVWKFPSRPSTREMFISQRYLSVCLRIHGGQRWMPAVFLSCILLYLLKQGISLNLELY